jgi:branched-subunit amino acid ABC-type transport system permease component
MADTEIFIIMLAAFLGSLVSGLLGYAVSPDPWDWKLFLATAIRGLMAAAVLAVSYPVRRPLSALDLLSALILGGGFDAILHKGAKILNSSKKGARSDD